MSRSFWKGVAVSYLLFTALAGASMKAVLPALNGLGVVYVGVTWPVAMTCIALHAKCSAVPPQRYSRWLFSFEEASNGEG